MRCLKIGLLSSDQREVIFGQFGRHWRPTLPTIPNFRATSKNPSTHFERKWIGELGHDDDRDDFWIDWDTTRAALARSRISEHIHKKKKTGENGKLATRVTESFSNLYLSNYVDLDSNQTPSNHTLPSAFY